MPSSRLTRLMKTRWYAQPHEIQCNYTHSLESASVNQATIMPILMYDEALSPSALETNPENAAFLEADGPNCYPDSTVDFLVAQVTFSLTKGAIETDKLHYVNIAYMPVMMSFLENYTAEDELSQLDISEILELQTESTDRQGFPLWNAVDMPARYGTSNLLSTTVPGLT